MNVLSRCSAPTRPCLVPLAVSSVQAQQQVRFASKKALRAKASTVTVQLLRDIPKFGRKGSIIPVARGRMRNIWYPRKQADYIPALKLRELRLNPSATTPILSAPDTSFRPDLVSPKPKLHLATLSPAKTVSLLETLIPSDTLVFVRATTSADPSVRTIHGSVTNADIADQVRAVVEARAQMLEGEEKRVVVSEEMVTVVAVGEGGWGGSAGVDESGKIKEVGEYVYEVRVKGAEDFVRRKVAVVRPEAGTVEQPPPAAAMETPAAA